MIKITDKHNCCGCSACVQACPMQCINFEEDAYGFRYPVVDMSQCVDCGICEKMCPMINREKESIEPKYVCAATNPDEGVRMQSSSGGVFTMLAESVLRQSGVVFGAKFNEQWEVVHDFADSIEGIASFRGSKYIQSIIGDTYKKARKILKERRTLLFTGTPCQISGLKSFLRKDYDNLLCVEIACHGVPSPMVWREYVRKIKGTKVLSSISFRDKRNGWKDYGVSLKDVDGKEVYFQHAAKNDYMLSFLRDLCIRPSCVNCPAKSGRSGADLLIGDFWGIEGMYPELDDNKGCSLVIAFTEKGKAVFESLDCKYIETTYEEAYRFNPCIIQPSHGSRYTPIFWAKFKKYGVEAAPMTLKIIKSGIFKRMLSLLWNKCFGKY